VIFRFVALGRILPLVRAYPWVMDVMFPLGGEGGRKDFDLPPGPSAKSWSSQPAVPGTILGLGGHVHDYATSIELVNETTGEVIWRQAPVVDSAGHVRSLTPSRLYRWYRLGAHVVPAHRYRVTVYYDNPTDELIRYGGMGAVAGLFRPDAGHAWPSVDTTNAEYRTYLDNLLRNMAGLDAGHGGHSHDR